MNLKTFGKRMLSVVPMGGSLSPAPTLSAPTSTVLLFSCFPLECIPLLFSCSCPLASVIWQPAQKAFLIGTSMLYSHWLLWLSYQLQHSFCSYTSSLIIRPPYYVQSIELQILMVAAFINKLCNLTLTWHFWKKVQDATDEFLLFPIFRVSW